MRNQRHLNEQKIRHTCV